MRSGFLLAIIILIIPACYSFSQSNTTESLTITTYFPSPNAAFRNMEVRAKLAVGEITQSNNAQFNTMAKLDNSSIYIGNATFLKPLAVPPSSPKFGEIFFNSTASKLQYWNGTWVNVGG